MARSNDDGANVNGEVLATDTLANLFAKENSHVIIHVGPNNDKSKGYVGYTYPMLIPRELSQYARAIEISVSGNWNAKRGEIGEAISKLNTVAEKIAFFENYVASGQWEPTEPTLRSPIEQAAYDVTLAASTAAGKIPPNASEKDKDRAIMPTVLGMLNNPAKTERGRPVLEAFLARMRDYDNNGTKRRVTGESVSTDDAPADMIEGF